MQLLPCAKSGDGEQPLEVCCSPCFPKSLRVFHRFHVEAGAMRRCRHVTTRYSGGLPSQLRRTSSRGWHLSPVNCGWTVVDATRIRCCGGHYDNRAVDSNKGIGNSEGKYGWNCSLADVVLVFRKPLKIELFQAEVRNYQ
jgi:hypothetical protein